MTCTDHQKMISKLMDCEVKAAECAELFDHLARCAECRRFFDIMTVLGNEMEKIQIPQDEVREEGWRAGGIGDRDWRSRGPITKARSPYQARQGRLRTMMLVGILVLLTGLFWTTAVTGRTDDRIVAAQQIPQPGLPNY